MKRLRKIYLEISNVCNLHCTFCPGTRREKRFMTADEFATLLPKLRRCAIPSLRNFFVSREMRASR